MAKGSGSTRASGSAAPKGLTASEAPKAFEMASDNEKIKGGSIRVNGKEVTTVGDFKEALLPDDYKRYNDISDAFKNVTVKFNRELNTLPVGTVFSPLGSSTVVTLSKINKDGSINYTTDRQTPKTGGGVKHEVFEGGFSKDLVDTLAVHVFTGTGVPTFQAYNAVMRRKKQFGK